MLVLVTGNPGSGKTLWTLPEVEKLREASKLEVDSDGKKRWPPDGRPVYYNGIELKPDHPGYKVWNYIDDAQARDPHKLPQGSIIVVDESYRLWEAPRKSGVEQPPYVQLFATHRHRGHDFYLICQKPSQLHHFIRDLVGRHIHFERQFGMDRSRRYEWQKLGDISNLKDPALMKSEFWYPKKIYDWYKSADIHVVKKRLPWLRLGGIAALVVGLVVMIVYTGYRLSHLAGDKPKPQPSEHTEASPKKGLPEDGKHWTAKFVERVPGAPYSAPVYDSVYQPKTFPKIAGCSDIKIVDRRSGDIDEHCRCNSQQGTTLTSISPESCRFYVKNGWFDETDTSDRYARRDDRQPTQSTETASVGSLFGH